MGVACTQRSEQIWVDGEDGHASSEYEGGVHYCCLITKSDNAAVVSFCVLLQAPSAKGVEGDSTERRAGRAEKMIPGGVETGGWVLAAAHRKRRQLSRRVFRYCGLQYPYTEVLDLSISIVSSKLKPKTHYNSSSFCIHGLVYDVHKNGLISERVYLRWYSMRLNRHRLRKTKISPSLPGLAILTWTPRAQSRIPERRPSINFITRMVPLCAWPPLLGCWSTA